MSPSQPKIEIDIPCDVQQEDESGVVRTFLDEARGYVRALSRAHLLTA